MREILEKVSYNAEGLVPVIVQSSATRRVLMMAWMNQESLERSLEIGETVFFSRSRGELWHKGATSGNKQHIDRIEIDCDGDTILAHVTEQGPACHNGTESCFDTFGAPIEVNE
jgi:phosphoribosyl-ATP pyrophosphohydrolase/phosphoribosyl-AMP cyclohydrolase